MNALKDASMEVAQYLIITANYWVFTLTDGALRMLVVLHFYTLGFGPLEIALLFLFYEIFGVITNLVGGWIGARVGLNTTMNIGLGIQILALLLLTVPNEILTIAWVMMAQALSGIAKDLNKMSAKSAVKTLVPIGAENILFKWVAILTGSKNALKGIGFFVGGLLLSTLGFRYALWLMALVLSVVWLFSLWFLHGSFGNVVSKPKFSDVFSKSSPINTLSAARLFLFGARDVWFVVALPVFLSQNFGWHHWSIGTFFACWIIGYGIIQSLAPVLLGNAKNNTPDGFTALRWALILNTVTIALSIIIAANWAIELSLIIGLFVFGAVFAINSSLHSYLVVSYADADEVSMDVGFYYMANAMGRLLGTILSGLLFQNFGLLACLIASCVFLTITSIISTRLPRSNLTN
jgi:MFS family permease